MARTKEDVIEEFRCQAIREAAIRVVARKGFTHATVQDIADEAGVAKGTVYLYFKSREEILEKAKAALIDELLSQIRDAVRDGRDFESAIEALVRTQLQFFDERQDFFRLYFASSEPSAEKRMRRDSYRAHVAQIAKIIDSAAARGEIRGDDRDAERIALAIAAVVRDIVLQRMTEKGIRPIEDDIRFARDFICRGILEELR